MEKYRINSVDEINATLISALVKRYTINEVPRLQKLKNYYIGQSDVKNRVMSDKEKPNNKIANSFGAYITDTVTGYWLGKPVVYQSQDKTFIDKINEVYVQSHEQDHNSKVGKTMTICGVAYELLYLNESSEIKMAEIEPTNIFTIYDSTVEEKPLAYVRFYDVEDYISNKIVTKVEVYTNQSIQHGLIDGDTAQLSEELEPHNFDGIPIIQYKNNDEMTGSFEKVIDLINSYDLAVSDTSNNLEYFADAYLVLSGMEDTEQEDIEAMKENRVMVLAENGKAEWLVKSASNVEVEEFKDRLREDIFTLSQVPNLSDDSFGNASSGVSLQYKLFGLENLVSISERKFKASLEKRMELICSILNLKGGNHNHVDVQITFTRNIPSNLSIQADVISKLSGLISNETLISLLPFVDNPALELEKLEAEKSGTLYENIFKEENINEEGLADIA